MTPLKAAGLNGAAAKAINEPTAMIAETINAALEGQSTAAIIQTLTGLLAGHIVNSADGQEDGIDDLLPIVQGNLKVFTDHSAVQHRLALLRQSMQ